MNKLLKLIARPQRWLPLLILVAAALPQARLHRSLWSDEAISWWFARLPLARLFYDLCDPHPPGYYLLLSFWQRGGTQEMWLRLPSLGAALLAIALTYRLGRAVCGGRWAAWAALLVALHPLQSWYSAEARMYALVQCLSLLMVWAGWRIMSRQPQRGPDWGQYILFGLAAVAAFGVDYGALLPFGLLQLLWLARGRPQQRAWLGLQLLTLALVGLVWVRPSHVTAIGQGYIPVFIAIQLNRLGLPSLTPETVSQMLLVGFGAGGLFSVGLAWRWPDLATRFGPGMPARTPVVVGWLLLLALTAWPRAFTLKRQLVVLLPYLALATAYGLSRSPRLWGTAVVISGLWVTSFILPSHPPEPWRTVVADLLDHSLSSPQTIWVDEVAVPVFSYYFSGAGSRSGAGQRLQNFYIYQPGRLPAPTARPGQTLWLVTAHNRYRDVTFLLPQDFDRTYQLQDALMEPGIGLYHYQRRKIPLTRPETPPASPAQTALWGGRLPSPLDTCATD